MNKCPKCGYQYGKNDAFCAMCGCKLVIDEFDKNNIQITKDAFFLNFQNNVKKGSKNKIEFFNSYLKNNPDNFVTNFIVCLFIICCILGSVLYIITNNQAEKRIELEYKNLINNPQQIPELKEPKSYIQLMENLSGVEKFLFLYLKFSNDPIDKKEQIFLSYLNELDKISNISIDYKNETDIKQCANIEKYSEKRLCVQALNKLYKNIGIAVYFNGDDLYLYPDYYFINKKYSKYLSGELKKYLNL